MITQYSLMLNRNEDSHPYLVKEASLEFSCERLGGSKKIADMLVECFDLANKAEEYAYLIVMDAATHPLGIFELSHGTVRASLVGMREIFLRVLLCGGTCFVIAHNHPSGDSQNPSDDDLAIFRKIKKAAEIMDIPMLDFLIIGDHNYLSFSEEEFT